MTPQALQQAHASGERIEFTNRHGDWRKWAPCSGVTLGRDDRQWRIAESRPLVDLTAIPFPFYTREEA